MRIRWFVSPSNKCCNAYIPRTMHSIYIFFYIFFISHIVFYFVWHLVVVVFVILCRFCYFFFSHSLLFLFWFLLLFGVYVLVLFAHSAKRTQCERVRHLYVSRNSFPLHICTTSTTNIQMRYLFALCPWFLLSSIGWQQWICFYILYGEGEMCVMYCMSLIYTVLRLFV